MTSQQTWTREEERLGAPLASVGQADESDLADRFHLEFDPDRLAAASAGRILGRAVFVTQEGRVTESRVAAAREQDGRVERGRFRQVEVERRVFFFFFLLDAVCSFPTTVLAAAAAFLGSGHVDLALQELREELVFGPEEMRVTFEFGERVQDKEGLAHPFQRREFVFLDRDLVDFLPPFDFWLLVRASCPFCDAVSALLPCVPARVPFLCLVESDAVHFVRPLEVESVLVFAFEVLLALVLGVVLSHLANNGPDGHSHYDVLSASAREPGPTTGHTGASADGTRQVGQVADGRGCDDIDGSALAAWPARRGTLCDELFAVKGDAAWASPARDDGQVELVDEIGSLLFGRDGQLGWLWWVVLG